MAIQCIYSGLRRFTVGPLVFCGVDTVDRGPMEVSCGRYKTRRIQARAGANSPAGQGSEAGESRDRA